MKGRRRQSIKRHKKHRQSKKTRKLSHRRKRSMKGGFNAKEWKEMWDGKDWDITLLSGAKKEMSTYGNSNGQLTAAGNAAAAAKKKNPYTQKVP